jgi:hypothetical protein
MRRSFIAWMSAAMVMAPSLKANELPAWQWSGYGSLAAHRAQGDGFRLRPDPSVASAAPPGAWRFDGDSRLGLQVRRSLGEVTELVAQVELSDDFDARWRPRLIWAYGSTRVGDNWTLRLGRQTLPTLRYSETRTVGYAQPGVRPPLTVYSLNPGTPIDGINLSWEDSVADGSLKLDLGAGRATTSRPLGQIDLRQSAVVALQWQGRDWLLRTSASMFRLDLTPNPLAALVTSGLCSNCGALQQAGARNRDIKGEMFSALLLWTPGAWEFGLELLERPRASSALVPATRGWALTSAWRSGAMQAHVAVGQQRPREKPLGLQAGASAPPGLVESVDRLLAQTGQDLRTVQIGLRWDWSRQLALKLQQERWHAWRQQGFGRSGVLEVAGPPLTPQTSSWNGVAVLSTISLDFVF